MMLCAWHSISYTVDMLVAGPSGILESSPQCLLEH